MKKNILNIILFKAFICSLESSNPRILESYFKGEINV
jgi:hypothetical protein